MQPPQKDYTLSRIQDDRLLEIFEGRSCATLPADVSATAYRLTRLLLAARSWGDVDVFTQVAEWPPDGYVAPVLGKWFIRFRWIPSFGADGLELVRL